MKIALIGQPNCGKSTLFNQVAGYKAETGNFSGTTVTYTESKVRVMGQVVEVIDLPGTYSLAGTNPAERESLRYLTSHEVDVIINVLDATHLAQGLELTYELLELGIPVVAAMNMLDDARRRGIQIDGPRLQQHLGIPVLPLVASRGRGVKEVFVAAQKAGERKSIPPRPSYSRDVEHALARIEEEARPVEAGVETYPFAVKLLEGDEAFVQIAERTAAPLARLAAQIREALESSRGQPALWILSGERHALASHAASSVVRETEKRTTWWDRLDDVFLHPVFGYVALILVLYLFFQGVYAFGSLVEQPLGAFFNAVQTLVNRQLGTTSLPAMLVSGLLQGVAGGATIVLPYLLPFLVGLSLLEDVGYLPRVAFMMDALMHRIGLHGKAIVPFILGYGCNVPAIMSTRILEDRRDRFLAASLATLVPCAARLAVVFGLVAFYLGPNLALAIYIFNLFVIALVARILARFLPEDSPGLILEMPVYRAPAVKNVIAKVWFRVHEFLVEAWPVLVAGSLVMALLEFFRLAQYFNILVRPISWALGLPKEVGVPLIFGVLRKELSLIMLKQALGGGDFSVVLTPEQMITFAVFVVFYVPCLATLAVIRKELGTRTMFSIAGLTTLVALAAALAARLAAILFLPSA